jgi:hypothetical protein
LLVSLPFIFLSFLTKFFVLLFFLLARLNSTRDAMLNDTHTRLFSESLFHLLSWSRKARPRITKWTTLLRSGPLLFTDYVHHLVLHFHRSENEVHAQTRVQHSVANTSG